MSATLAARGARALFADRSLARRIESGEALGRLAYLESLARLFPDVRTDQLGLDGAWATFTDNDPYHSRVTGLGLAGSLGDDSLERIEEFFAGHGRAPVIDLAPHAGGALASTLARHGYRTQYYLNVLGLPLDESAERIPLAVPVELATPDQISLWVGTAVRGFDVEQRDARWYARLMHAYAARPGTFCFLARGPEGEVAGTGALSISGGIATLHATATVPTFRRIGVHRSLLEARIAFAASAGCDLAVVQTSVGAASQRNVERAGFRVLYTRTTLIADGGADSTEAT